VKKLFKLALAVFGMALVLGGLFWASKLRNVCRETPAEALVARQSLEEITQEAQAVFIGRVTGISQPKLASEGNRWSEDVLIYHEVTIKPERFLFNAIGLADPVKIAVLGGEVKLPREVAVKKGNPDLTRVAAAEATFEKGERVLVFVKRGFIGYKKISGAEGKMERLALVGAWQGKFRIEGEKAINYLPTLSRTVPEIERIVEARTSAP